jgi:hypothetical protein
MEREYITISVIEVAHVMKLPHVVETLEDASLKVNYYHSPCRSELYMKAIFHKSSGVWAYSAPRGV